MLILSRKVGQTIVIPGITTELQILSIVGSQVRIGISAPATVSVRRQGCDKALVEDRRPLR
ncbi:carbon storage regulator [Schlesneria paludicola]|uniref:carbon storage regulator n=1 Tax=Schlesneria paludicola TaxID=360056 RepID=UPI00029ACFB4|nr:carbon storage regulator [Schlesneria paludicola]